MEANYYRKQRASILEPATVGDIPPEVIGEAFYYLLLSPKDLYAASKVCSAWRPIAQKLLNHRVRFFSNNWWKCEGRICGILLKSVVFRDSINICRVELDTDPNIGLDLIRLLACVVSRTLRSFKLSANIFGVEYDCMEYLETFLTQCKAINRLELVSFRFTYDEGGVSRYFITK
jgi:hypothetical protein